MNRLRGLSASPQLEENLVLEYCSVVCPEGHVVKTAVDDVAQPQIAKIHLLHLADNLTFVGEKRLHKFDDEHVL